MARIKYPVSAPTIGQREQEAVRRVLASGWLTHGPIVELFEEQFARRLGVKYAIACSSGTTALHLALSVLGLREGSEVVVPDLTFVATANAVSYIGARPVFADVDPENWCVTFDSVKKVVSVDTSAIIPVHLYGQSPNMHQLVNLTKALEIPLVEDACQGLGGYFNAQELGSFGDMSVFSFYGNKILTTGEGGMVCTNSSSHYQYLHHLRGQGMAKHFRYYHDVVGFNYRMTSMQAAIGLAQLEQLDEFLGERDRICDAYRSEFKDVFQMMQHDAAPWLFTFLLPRGIARDLVMECLVEDGIETRPVFVPMHKLPMYQGNDSDFPIATDVGERGLSLPTYVGMSQGDATRIAHRVMHAVERVVGGGVWPSMGTV